jgi:hypothetical protein
MPVHDPIDHGLGGPAGIEYCFCPRPTRYFARHAPDVSGNHGANTVTQHSKRRVSTFRGEHRGHKQEVQHLARRAIIGQTLLPANQLDKLRLGEVAPAQRRSRQPREVATGQPTGKFWLTSHVFPDMAQCDRGRFRPGRKGERGESGPKIRVVQDHSMAQVGASCLRQIKKLMDGQVRAPVAPCSLRARARMLPWSHRYTLLKVGAGTRLNLVLLQPVLADSNRISRAAPGSPVAAGRGCGQGKPLTAAISHRRRAGCAGSAARGAGADRR